MASAGLDAQLMTVGEVAQLMRVSNMTVYRLIKAGQLRAVRVGKNYRIRHRDLEAFLSERSVRQTPKPMDLPGRVRDVWAKEEA